MIDDTLLELYCDLKCVYGLDPDIEFVQIVQQEHPELTSDDVQKILEQYQKKFHDYIVATYGQKKE